MGNTALDHNPPGGDRHITTHASDWLWAVFAIMLLSMLISIFWTTSSTHRNRTFHQIPVIVLTVATIAYFAMASDLGWTLIAAEFGSQPTRQIWYVRYIQWFINAPLLLLGLLLLTGLSISDILTTMFFSWVLVICGLVGALTHSSYKWGFYAFGLFALFYIWYRLHGHSARFPYRGQRSGYHGGAGYLSFIWLLYPICWGLSEGSNRISPTSEMVFYGILDILSGPVFLAIFMSRVHRLSQSELGNVGFGATGRGLVGEKNTGGNQPGMTGAAAGVGPGRTGAVNGADNANNVNNV
ncbi:hypothetical protein BJ138DRAFT_1012888 [Hygrophoropsis aurantiaca]|uniref:Uncharacterized protein n=1 Tax=Hygrophoropsis aurantiaca TaxID=72124 RepID=A0ACB8A4I4_9AGAM|nr:hypothetical protein BJ138DRAFT_1012888 [Hygrophoropsis aurantiaca]